MLCAQNLCEDGQPACLGNIYPSSYDNGRRVLLSPRIWACSKTLTQDSCWSPWHSLRKMTRRSYEGQAVRTVLSSFCRGWAALPAHKETDSQIFPSQASDSRCVCSTHPSWGLCHRTGSRCPQRRPLKAKPGMSPPEARGRGPLCVPHHQSLGSFLLGSFKK